MSRFNGTGSDIKHIVVGGEEARMKRGNFVLLTDCLAFVNNVSRGQVPIFDGAATVAGDQAVCRIVGEFIEVPKTTGQAWTEGQNLYWDNTNFAFTSTASTNKLVAKSMAIALAADTTGWIVLTP